MTKRKQAQAKPKGRHGGARPGSGGKPAPPVIVRDAGLKTADPAAFLCRLMQMEEIDLRLRHDAAKKLVDLEKLLSKKKTTDAKREGAERAVASGRFAPMSGPRLRLVK